MNRRTDNRDMQSARHRPWAKGYVSQLVSTFFLSIYCADEQQAGFQI
ncbi:hypothetical protein MIZ03_0083 [Rhodoferax lithotrophicus]|uniref:Uncharacterized protein n=1 Tax=Rhodoferax lithotrophicus TaxID=2798804 RepID=A0ABM7MGC7_9BURK|nr:hypothetical protein MIZ03_0083 [Rhodoferax sp. MIZ03]